MKKTAYLLMVFLFAFAVNLKSQFATGNLIVVQGGNGAVLDGGSAIRCVLKEYTPAGVLVSSTPMPTIWNGNTTNFMLNYGFFGGLITLSSNGRYLLLPGFNVAEGSTPLYALNSSIAQRIVARIDKNKNINLVTNTGAFSGETPMSAYSNNGYDIWVSGSNNNNNGTGGLRYMTFESNSSTLLNSSNLAIFQLNAFDNQLYLGCEYNNTLIGAVGNGFPTGTNTSVVNLPGLVANNKTPQGFFMADLDASIPGVDVLYLLDANGGGTTGNTILKYSKVGTNWVLNNSKVINNPRGLTGVVNGSTVTLFATSNQGLHKLVDASGYNSNLTAAFTDLATAPTNTVFYGLAFAPSASPSSEIAKPKVKNLKDLCRANTISEKAKITNWNSMYNLSVTQNGNTLPVNMTDTSFEYFVPMQAAGIYNYKIKFTQNLEIAVNDTSVKVNQFSTPYLNLAISVAPYCTEKNVFLLANYFPSGSNYAFVWKDGSTILGNSSTANFTANFSTAGIKKINASYTFVSGAECVSTNSANSDTITITVLQKPAIPIIFQNVNYLTVSNTMAGYTYQWQKLNSVTLIWENILLAVSSDFTANSNGKYRVIASNNGCFSTESAIIDVVSTSIFNYNRISTSSLKVSPNPINFQSIISNFDPSVSKVKVVITNINGVILSEEIKNITSFGVQLGLKVNLNKGMYFIKVFDANNKNKLLGIEKILVF